MSDNLSIKITEKSQDIYLKSDGKKIKLPKAKYTVTKTKSPPTFANFVGKVVDDLPNSAKTRKRIAPREANEPISVLHKHGLLNIHAKGLAAEKDAKCSDVDLTFYREESTLGEVVKLFSSNHRFHKGRLVYSATQELAPEIGDGLAKFRKWWENVRGKKTLAIKEAEKPKLNEVPSILKRSPTTRKKLADLFKEIKREEIIRRYQSASRKSLRASRTPTPFPEIPYRRQYRSDEERNLRDAAMRRYLERFCPERLLMDATKMHAMEDYTKARSQSKDKKIITNSPAEHRPVLIPPRQSRSIGVQNMEALRQKYNWKNNVALHGNRHRGLRRSRQTLGSKQRHGTGDISMVGGFGCKQRHGLEGEIVVGDSGSRQRCGVAGENVGVGLRSKHTHGVAGENVVAGLGSMQRPGHWKEEGNTIRKPRGEDSVRRAQVRFKSSDATIDYSGENSNRAEDFDWRFVSKDSGDGLKDIRRTEGDSRTTIYPIFDAEQVDQGEKTTRRQSTRRNLVHVKFEDIERPDARMSNRIGETKTDIFPSRVGKDRIATEIASTVAGRHPTAKNVSHVKKIQMREQEDTWKKRSGNIKERMRQSLLDSLTPERLKEIPPEKTSYTKPEDPGLKQQKKNRFLYPHLYHQDKFHRKSSIPLSSSISNRGCELQDSRLDPGKVNVKYYAACRKDSDKPRVIVTKSSGAFVTDDAKYRNDLEILRLMNKENLDKYRKKYSVLNQSSGINTKTASEIQTVKSGRTTMAEKSLDTGI